MQCFVWREKRAVPLTRCIVISLRKDDKYSGCINTPHGGRTVYLKATSILT